MNLRIHLLAAALALAAIGAGAAELGLPDSAAFTFLSGREAIAVMETAPGRVKIAKTGKGGKPGPWRQLTGISRPAAIAADEAGTLLVVERSGGGYRLAVFEDGKPSGGKATLKLKPRQRVVGAAAGNGILWLVLRNPVGLLQTGYDGSIFSQTQGLERLARTPFSITLDPSGGAFVTDPMGPSVLAFSSTGTFEALHDLTGTGITRPTGIAADAWGTIWVSDGVTGRVACMQISGNKADIGCMEGDRPRYDDPLRLISDPSGTYGTWVLECREGRLTRLEEQRQ